MAEGLEGTLQYVFGGVPKTGKVDCSSFVNMVIGWKLGLPIPGYKAGTYKGATHGPVVMSYATWTGGSTRVKIPQPGDLVIWAGLGALGHIGIAVSETRMVSALNPASGVVETPIKGYGPAAAPLTYRTLKDSAGSGATAAGAGAAAASCSLTGAAGVRWITRRRRRRARGQAIAAAALELAAAERPGHDHPAAADQIISLDA
jgi:hypothetical protein